MSWNLIKSIQKDTDLRLILPFGLHLRLGDVVSVGRDGDFALEGNCESLLNVRRGTPREAGGKIDLFRQSAKHTECNFRAAGTASTLFPNLPSASAGFDISFGSQDGWVLAVTGRALTSLDEINRFRRPILKAYELKIWKPDWALVTSVATIKRMTLIASQTRNTKVALDISGDFAPGAGLEAKLTAGASIASFNQDITQCITAEPMAAFCTAIRVRDRWWSTPDISALAKSVERVEADPGAAPDPEFWEDVDDLD